MIQIAYSELTKRFYFLPVKGKKIDITNDINEILKWHDEKFNREQNPERSVATESQSELQKPENKNERYFYDKWIPTLEDFNSANVLNAIHDAIVSQTSIQEKEQDMGTCRESNCKEKAVIDYNGHGHFVCQPHYDELSKYFDEEYK